MACPACSQLSRMTRKSEPVEDRGGPSNSAQDDGPSNDLRPFKSVVHVNNNEVHDSDSTSTGPGGEPYPPPPPSAGPPPDPEAEPSFPRVGAGVPFHTGMSGLGDTLDIFSEEDEEDMSRIGSPSRPHGYFAGGNMSNEDLTARAEAASAAAGTLGMAPLDRSLRIPACRCA